MTTDALLQALTMARARREACVLATVAAVKGSVPRHPGAKALVFPDGRIQGTIGGGKFEALVLTDALGTLATGKPLLKTYPLHEKSPQSFGAICGGEVTVFLEPQLPGESLVICGAGHCGQALARLAIDCGWHVTLVDDREEHLEGATASLVHHGPAAEYLGSRKWTRQDAIVLVSRNYVLDREALIAALQQEEAGYVGMIGSRKKTRAVFDELRAQGHDAGLLARVHAPIGLDIDADAPMEIAVSILAEVMAVLRQRSGRSLRETMRVGGEVEE